MKRKKFLKKMMIALFIISMQLVSFESNAAVETKHTCAKEDCQQDGIYAIPGPYSIEWYCPIHYSHLQLTGIPNERKKKDYLPECKVCGKTVTPYDKKPWICESCIKKTCVGCGKPGSKTYTNPFSGKDEWYCLDCYNEMMDTIGMMESDVGAGTASKHQCEECSKEGTHSIIGFSGKTEYYCTQHYNEMSEMLEMIQGK